MTVVAVPLTDVWAAAGSAERVTQALLGEPALVLDERGDWARVALPWQPGPDPRGYLGWVRRAHLRAGHPTAQATPGGPPDVLDAARRLLGAPYLWAAWGRPASTAPAWSTSRTDNGAPGSRATRPTSTRLLSGS